MSSFEPASVCLSYCILPLLPVTPQVECDMAVGTDFESGGRSSDTVFCLGVVANVTRFFRQLSDRTTSAKHLQWLAFLSIEHSFTYSESKIGGFWIRI